MVDFLENLPFSVFDIPKAQRDHDGQGRGI